MPIPFKNRLASDVRKPTNKDDLESMSVAVFGDIYCSPCTSKYGRPGQKQDGLDLFVDNNARREDTAEPKRLGVQCKFTEKDRLPLSAVEADILKVKRSRVDGTFSYPLDEMVIVTTARNDATLQRDIQALREAEGITFTISVMAWDAIAERVMKSDWLWERYNCASGEGLLPEECARVDRALCELQENFGRGAYASTLLGWNNLNREHPQDAWKRDFRLRELLLELARATGDAVLASHINEFNLGMAPKAAANWVRLLASLRMLHQVHFERPAGIFTAGESPRYFDSYRLQLQLLSKDLPSIHGTVDEMATLCCMLVAEGSSEAAEEALMFASTLPQKERGLDTETAALTGYAVAQAIFESRFCVSAQRHPALLGERVTLVSRKRDSLEVSDVVVDANDLRWAGQVAGTLLPDEEARIHRVSSSLEVPLNLRALLDQCSRSNPPEIPEIELPLLNSVSSRYGLLPELQSEPLPNALKMHGFSTAHALATAFVVDAHTLLALELAGALRAILTQHSLHLTTSTLEAIQGGASGWANYCEHPNLRCAPRSYVNSARRLEAAAASVLRLLRWAARPGLPVRRPGLWVLQGYVDCPPYLHTLPLTALEEVLVPFGLEKPGSITLSHTERRALLAWYQENSSSPVPTAIETQQRLGLLRADFHDSLQLALGLHLPLLTVVQAGRHMLPWRLGIGATLPMDVPTIREAIAPTSRL